MLKNIGGHIFFQDEDDNPVSTSSGLTTWMNAHQVNRQQLSEITGKSLSIIGRWIAGSSVPPQTVMHTLLSYKPPSAPIPASTPPSIPTPSLPYDIDGELLTFTQSTITSLQALMKAYQLSSTDLAELIGVSRTAVYNWLSGHNVPSQHALAILYEYILLNEPPPAPAIPPGARMDINNVLLRPDYRARAKGRDQGDRQLIMYYSRVTDARMGRMEHVPVMSITWVNKRSKSLCTVRTLLKHPTHDLAPHNGRTEAHDDRTAVDPALRAAGYRLIVGKRPVSQLLYIGRHLISPAEPSSLVIVCHRCNHQHNHPFTVYDGGPVRPSHIPDFM